MHYELVVAVEYSSLVKYLDFLKLIKKLNMEYPHLIKHEKTLKQKLEDFVFLIPLVSALTGLAFFIFGTLLSFKPSIGRLTGGSPAFAAWQGLLLFLYSLFALGHFASKSRTAISNFIILRLVSRTFLVLISIQSFASLLAGGFLLILTVPEILAGLLGIWVALI